MSETQNTETVQQAYAKFKTGDMPGLISMFAEEITWTYPEIPGVPYAKCWTGRAGVTQFFTNLNETAECLDFSPREFTAAGDKVIAQGSYTFRVRETGRTYTCEFAHFFEVRDGIVQNFQEYTDTLPVMRAYEKAMSA